MSNDGDDEARRRRERIARASYDRGYGKPPVEHQFGEGRPNPSTGRKPGSNNRQKGLFPSTPFSLSVVRHGLEPIRLTDQSGTREVPRIEGLLSAEYASGIKGNQRATQNYSNRFEHAESVVRLQASQMFAEIMEYKNYAAWEAERQRACGIFFPKILPHPDHVQASEHYPFLKISGPSTREEQETWDAVIDCLERRRGRVVPFEEALERAGSEIERQGYQRVIDSNLGHIRFLEWWLQTYDGGPRCTDGHTREELRAALKRFMPRGWLTKYRQSLREGNRRPGPTG